MFATNNLYENLSRPIPNIVKQFREIFRGAYRGCMVDISRNIFRRNRVNVELFFEGGSIVIHSSASAAKWAIKNALEAFRKHPNTVGIESDNGEYAFHVGKRLAPARNVHSVKLKTQRKSLQSFASALRFAQSTRQSDREKNKR